MTQPITPKFTDEQYDQAAGVIAGLAGQLLAGNAIPDADRLKFGRLHSKMLNTRFDGGTTSDEDVVRNNAVIMIVAGASFGDVIKYMIDCLTGNPVTAVDALEDDPDLLDDLGGGAAEDPDLAQPQPAAGSASPRQSQPADNKRGRRGGGPR